MKTCDRCLHYTESESSFAGACARMKDANLMDCPKDGAVGWDYECYIAGVYVGPKFGCIHWVKK